MRKLKKYFLSIIFLFIVALHAVASEKIDIHINKGLLNIPVYLDETENNRGVALTISFDKNVLKAIDGSLKKGILINDYKVETGLFSEGNLSLGIYPFHEKYPTKGVICYLQFYSFGEIGSSTTIEFSKFESNNVPVNTPDSGGFFVNGRTWDILNVIITPPEFKDAIVNLQMLSSFQANTLTFFTDMNHDEKTGIEDVIYILNDIVHRN